MAVSTGEVFYHTPTKVEIWSAGSATAQGTVLVKDGRFGVTLTDTTGVATADIEIGPYTVNTGPQPGASLEDVTAIASFPVGVALDGTWEFASITGVTSSTAQGTVIYITGGGALTTTATDNTRFGVVNYPATYSKAAGVAPVQIGV
jgi:hypothetical protein